MDILKKSRFATDRIGQTIVLVAVVSTVLLFSDSAWGAITRSVFFALGVMLVGVCALGRVWCSMYISGRKSNTLVTVGPYSLCRNPLYLFSMAGAVGLGLSTGSLILAGLVAAFFVLYYPAVIEHEEKHLEDRHGEAFRAYRESVPRFIPDFRRFSEPETYAVVPLVFRRRLVDAFWFVCALGLVEIVEASHRAHILPTLFRLY